MQYNSSWEVKLKEICKNNIQKHKFENSLAAISALAYIYYHRNQFYSCEILEKYLLQIGDQLRLSTISKDELQSETIFFYDGFGIDIRGLAYIYLKALCSLKNKKIIYATALQHEDRIPLLKSLLEKNGVEMVYFSITGGYLKQIKQIDALLQANKPGVSFIYTTPWDVAAVTVFNKQRNIKRVQVNLTDHAFWLGINMFDVCVEFRDYGFSLSRDYRKIPENKLTILPFYPHIENNCEYEGLPFSVEGKKLIFSGGALYKTLSDDNKYYKIVKEILTKHDDVVFLYAGSGDATKLNMLRTEFPERVYHITERKDFFKIIEKSYFYLNTYPHLGGLMTQYAVAAGKLPITLKYDQGSDGLLLNQNKISVFYSTMEELLSDVHKLLSDKNYLQIKEKEIKDSLMTEEKFVKEINNIVEYGKTTILPNYQPIDVERTKREYLFRFTSEKIESAIANRRNKALIRYFPHLFLKRFIKKILLTFK